MGMLRTLVVVGAVFALMPSPPPGPNGEVVPAGPGSFAYVAAAAETVADMRAFCRRNPNVCATAGAMAQTVESKAKYSAKLIYEWANDASGKDQRQSSIPQVESSDPIQTASTPAQDTALYESQNTLTLTDLLPEWRKPARHSRG